MRHPELLCGFNPAGLGPRQLRLGLEYVDAGGIAALDQNFLDPRLRFDVGFGFAGKFQHLAGPVKIEQRQQALEDQRLADLAGAELSPIQRTTSAVNLRIGTTEIKHPLLQHDIAFVKLEFGVVGVRI